MKKIILSVLATLVSTISFANSLQCPPADFIQKQVESGARTFSYHSLSFFTALSAYPEGEKVSSFSSATLSNQDNLHGVSCIYKGNLMDLGFVAFTNTPLVGKNSQEWETHGHLGPNQKVCRGHVAEACKFIEQQ